MTFIDEKEKQFLRLSEQYCVNQVFLEMMFEELGGFIELERYLENRSIGVDTRNQNIRCRF